MTQVPFTFGVGVGLIDHGQLDANFAAGLQHSRVTLTSAQIRTLATVPVQVIPSPGPGLYIMLVQCSAALIFKTVAYNVTAGSIMQFTTAADSALNQSSGTTDFVNSAAASVDSFRGSSPGIVHLLANLINSPMMVSISGGANPTLGDSTIDLDLFYVIVAS